MYKFLKVIAILLVIAGILSVIGGMAAGYGMDDFSVVFGGGLLAAIGFTIFVLNRKGRQ